MEKYEQTTNDAQKTTSARKKTVLVVDDNADFLYLSKTILETEDYTVLTAQGGTEAFSILNEVNKLDLILLDLRMEDMSGSEFLEKLEQTKPEIVETVPVVFLTGMDKVPISKAVGFIRKPYDMDDFLAAVHNFIEAGVPRITENEPADQI